MRASLVFLLLVGFATLNLGFSSCEVRPQEPVEVPQPAPMPSPTPVVATPTPEPTPEPTPSATPLPKLSWEASHPERSAWTASTVGFVTEVLSSLDKASDTKTFCPRYAALSKDQKIAFWSELFSAMALYESNWNPAAASVDVGIKGQRDTYSIGLLQMSVVDQSSYHMPLGYDYDDLLKPTPNLHLAVKIMANRIEKYGKIVISTGAYWAVIKAGNRYQKINEISAMTKKISFCKEAA